MTLRHRGFSGPVSLVSAEGVPPYERPLLSKDLLTERRSPDNVFLRPRDSYQDAGIAVRLGTRAVGVDRARSTVLLDDGDELGFEALVLATGSVPRRPPAVPEAANVQTLRSLDDALRLRSALVSGGRILVMGAGFLGCEVAAAARLRGCAVVLCDVAEAPMAGAIGAELGGWFAELHRAHGVDVRMQTTVSGWELEAERVSRVHLDDGTVHDVDAALIAVGVDADLELPRQAGLRQGGGGILVDEALRAAPDILCAGDIAAHQHPVYEEPVRLEHWQVAQRHGEWCASLLAGGSGALRELPWFWSDQYDVQLTQLGCSAGADERVWRGERTTGCFSVFHLRDGRVLSVIGVNDSVTVRRSRSLINSAARVSARQLADAGADVRHLLAS